MHSDSSISKPALFVCKNFAVNLAGADKDLLLKVLEKRIFRNRNFTMSSYLQLFK